MTTTESGEQKLEEIKESKTITADFAKLQMRLISLLLFEWIPCMCILTGSPSELLDFFFFLWVLRTVKIISLILSRVNRKVRRKREIPEKNHLTTRKQNLACLTCDPS